MHAHTANCASHVTCVRQLRSQLAYLDHGFVSDAVSLAVLGGAAGVLGRAHRPQQHRHVTQQPAVALSRHSSIVQ